MLVVHRSYPVTIILIASLAHLSFGTQLKPLSTFVYLVQQDSTVVVRNIQVGTIEGGNAEITSGLQAGDGAVLSGADKLEQGSKVAAQIQGESPSPKTAPQNAPAAAKQAKKSP